MKNAAGDHQCDRYLKEELDMAGIPFYEFSFVMSGEVPSSIRGFLNGWVFHRAWTYWVAEAKDNLLLFEYADILHKDYGNVVRVAGHCGCPSPREWYQKAYALGVFHYHIDTQEGLKALAEVIKDQGGCTIGPNGEEI